MCFPTRRCSHTGTQKLPALSEPEGPAGFAFPCPHAPLRAQQPNNPAPDFGKAGKTPGKRQRRLERPALPAAVMQPLLLLLPLLRSFACRWEPRSAELPTLSMARRRPRGWRSQTPADLGADTCSRSILLSKPFLSAEDGADTAQRDSHLEGSLVGFCCC